MVSLFRVASFTGLLIAATTLHGCGGSGGTPSSSGGGTSHESLSLPANHGLAAGMFTVAAGGSAEHGNVEVSCPAGGSACVVTVAADGTASYDQTGGVPGVDGPISSMLTDAYDIVPDGGYAVLPPNADYLIADVAAARTRAGGTELTHSRGRYAYGANRVNSQANTLFMGSRVGSWDRRLAPFACSGRVCASVPPGFEVRADNQVVKPDANATVLQKNGISVLQWANAEEPFENLSSYGTYENEGFALLSDVSVGFTTFGGGESFDYATGESYGAFSEYAHSALGYVAGTNPGGNASYQGLMLGSVVEKDGDKELNVPNWVIGDAALEFDFANSDMDATFSNVIGLVSGQTYGDLA